MKNRDQYFAEIVESSLQQWTAQSWSWDKFPNFGSLVVVEQSDLHLYGIVSQIQTGSSDPTRMPHVYKKTENELLQDQPQIFEFLRTVFTCIPISYKSMQVCDQIIYSLPIKPAKIHAFVRDMTYEEKKELHITNCLPTIFNNSNLYNIDELLLALINELRQDRDSIYNFLENYSLLCGNDYRRMKIFISRIERNLHHSF
jgi:hypothetical protein